MKFLIMHTTVISMQSILAGFTMLGQHTIKWLPQCFIINTYPGSRETMQK